MRFCHDDAIKWKHFPRYWPFARGIHRSPVNYPHKGEWRGALMFSLIFTWINGSVNNREAGDLRHHRAYYDVIVMYEYFILALGVFFFREHKFHLDVNLKHSVKCLLTREWHELFTTNFCVHPDGSVVRRSHKLVGIWFLNLTSRKKKLFSTRGEFFVELVPIARQMHGTYDGRLYY